LTHIKPVASVIGKARPYSARNPILAPEVLGLAQSIYARQYLVLRHALSCIGDCQTGSFSRQNLVWEDRIAVREG